MQVESQRRTLKFRRDMRIRKERFRGLRFRKFRGLRSRI